VRCFVALRFPDFGTASLPAGFFGSISNSTASSSIELRYTPEPPADARPRAVACAKERYQRLIKSAGRAMVGESKLAMEDLVADLERP
jgi:hypothetical protein